MALVSSVLSCNWDGFEAKIARARKRTQIECILRLRPHITFLRSAFVNTVSAPPILS